jgi:type I restriction enzyme M protein
VDTFEEEEPIDLNAVASELIKLDDNLEDVNSEIIGFCNELGIVPPFKVEDKK